MLGIRDVFDFELKFIGPRCGSAGCHQSVFPPGNLDKPGMVRSALVGVKSQTLCQGDEYVNPADPAKSFVLAKVNAVTDHVQCPSGGAAGGLRMPTAQGQPAMVAPRLSDDELDCFTWYIETIAAQ